MPNPIDLKPLTLSLSGLAHGSRALSVPQPNSHELGFFESRRLGKEQAKATALVQTQFVRDAAEAQAQVNRAHIVNAANVAVAAITCRGATANQQLLCELTQTSSATVSALVNASLQGSLQTLHEAEAQKRQLQADVDSGKLSPEVAQQALLLLSEATNTEINTRRELAHNGVEHTKRLTNMVFQISRLGSADDSQASS